MISGAACTLGYTGDILGPYFLESFQEVITKDGVKNGGFQVVVGGDAYGSGSSREVAVVAHPVLPQADVPEHVLGRLPAGDAGEPALGESAVRIARSETPAIAPLDVAAIEAQLAAAQADMDASRAATDAAMERLERLSGR